MAHQSLYRRYRPRRFAEVRGQDHVVTALRNAVRSDTAGHAYLFSGPRGTGKTSTARILAKALNCEDLRDGEPCCECGPCRDIETGRSFDLFELDAASNNGVDAVRDLTERAAVGSPGRTKVYILDEVHMLSTAASNALLKTLEEPPGHVCFVLATTDPQKVLPTIRSRTQHYEFQLLSARELTDYVEWIAQDASLEIDDESVAYVVRQGRGSARDTLSALDQVVAAGGVINRALPVDRLLQALAESNSGAAVVAVSDALALGHDPRVLADALLVELRDAFLLSLGVEVAHLVDTDADRLGRWAGVLGTPRLTRAIEAVGSAMVDMRQAADPRVPLEVALVRLCTAPVGASGGDGPDPLVADLTRRIEVLERQVAGDPGHRGGATATDPSDARTTPHRAASSTPSGPPPPSADDGSPAPETSTPTGDGPAAARAALGAVRNRSRRETGADRTVASVAGDDAGDGPRGRPAAPRPPALTRSGSRKPPPSDEDQPARPSHAVSPPSREAASPPDRDALTLAFGDVVLPGLTGVAKALYSRGRFVAAGGAGVVFELENGPTRERAERYRSQVEAALSSHFGTPVTLVLTDATDPGGVARADDTARTDDTAPTHDSDHDEESAIIDVHDLEDADVAATGVEKLTQAFPGAVLVDGSDQTS